MNSSQFQREPKDILLGHRYLWAANPAAATIPPGELVQGRYQVVAPQIWRDTLPEQPPHPEQLPNSVYPYLRLYPQRLHVPEAYGYAVLETSTAAAEILLLENAPIDATGKLVPSLVEALPQAPAVRQIYWLWQILELWKPLADNGVSYSLLVEDNLRVDGWRVRLLELYATPVEDTGIGFSPAHNGNGASDKSDVVTQAFVELPLEESAASALSLYHLGSLWARWCRLIHVSVATQVLEICEQMQAGNTSEKAIAQKLNQLLLEQAALLPLRLRVAGATDTGPQRDHNEDTCYPTIQDSKADYTSLNDPLLPHLSIVCDGIGGHEGGEVASLLAVQSLKLQVRALLAEVAEQTEIVQPELLKEQLAASIRVVNNLISSRNDEQGRESRRRMGTTLVMALQLPQKVSPNPQTLLDNAHELYIANVGDSRAYWITPHSCQQLTVDDDVASREVRLGRSFYREALQRPDSGALTQALGTRDAEFLRPNVQRFIVEEDGLLLLCSDGLSDNNWVEQSWADFVEPIMQSKIPLEAAVQSWIELANQRNGHDNTSVVITYCRVSPEYPVLLNLGEIGSKALMPKVNLQPEIVEGAVYAEAVPSQEVPVPATPRQRRHKTLALWLGLLLLLIGGSIAGLYAWRKYDQRGFNQMRDRIFPPSAQPLPSPDAASPSPLSPPSPQDAPSPIPSVPPPPSN